MRALVRLERIWGKIGGGTSSSQLNILAGMSPGGPSAGEERERRLFGDALRDGFVLCQYVSLCLAAFAPRN